MCRIKKSQNNTLTSKIEKGLNCPGNMNFTRSSIWLATALSLGTVFGVHAQEASKGQDQDTEAKSAFGFEKITVSARKRPETVQDAPVVVNSIGEQLIESAGIEELADYAGLVPNLTVVETQSSAFAFVLIRGITQVRNTESSIAYVVDGVLNTSPFGFSQDLVDVQQIEVLKGPQGALYGRNAVGGAITITTKTPSDELEGYVKASAGDGDMWGLQGAISGAIVEDKLLFRLTGYAGEADGWRDNITVNQPIDGYEKAGARLKLLYYPTDDLTVDLRATYQTNEGVGQAFVNIAPFFQCGGGPVFVEPNCVVQGNLTTGAPDAPAALQGLIGNPNDSTPPPQGNILGIDERDIVNFSLKLDWELDDMTVTSITSYDEIDALLGGDQFPYTEAATLKNAQRRDNESFSQEFRLTSNNDGPFKWMAGAYYSESDFLFTANIEVDPGDGSEPTRIVDRPAAGSTAFNSDINENTSFSVFGQASYDVTEDVEVSFALRYDDEERTQTVNTPNAFAATFSTLEFGDSRTESWDALQPKLTVRWQPERHITIFGSYAQAFRTGGFNPSDIAAEVASSTSFIANTSGLQDIYDEEKTDGFEIGFKTSWWDDTFRFNGAAFHTNVDNQFTFNFIADLSNAQTVRNIDESKIKGFEFDTQWVINDFNRLSASVGFTDTEITRWQAEPIFEGNPLPFIPEWTASASYELRMPINDRMTGYLRFDWQYIDEVTFVPAAFTTRDELNLINIRATLEIDEDLTLAAWVKNATDEDYLAEWGNPPGFAYYASLRQAGIELKYRF